MKDGRLCLIIFVVCNSNQVYVKVCLLPKDVFGRRLDTKVRNNSETTVTIT